MQICGAAHWAAPAYQAGLFESRNNLAPGSQPAWQAGAAQWAVPQESSPPTMQKLAEVCIRRPIFAVMLIMALVVVGGVSYTKLGVDRFPNVDLPIISVRTILPGASPEEIESTITRRVEDAIATVEGIENIRATSTESTSILTVTFTLKRDIDVAAQDVRDAVATVISLLPRDAKPPLIKKLDTDASPIVSLVLAGTRTPRAGVAHDEPLPGSAPIQ